MRPIISTTYKICHISPNGLRYTRNCQMGQGSKLKTATTSSGMTRMVVGTINMAIITTVRACQPTHPNKVSATTKMTLTVVMVSNNFY